MKQFYVKQVNKHQNPKRLLIGGMMLGMTSLFGACATTHSTPTVYPPHWATLIDASANFYQVDDKLYRSEQLTTKDLALLEQAGIKTIVNLRFFDRDDDKQAFGATAVRLVNTPLLTWSIKPDDLAKVLYIIHHAQKDGAVLVHCYHGSDRTGVVVAMYRVIYQGWSVADAKAEMQQGDFGYHSIWKNIDRLLDDESVSQVRASLDRLNAK
ncbi:fused DSP-PTPase phosphatase/NAD kinase-like protein [Moraxella porci]|uniref:fused DSP-PTPase phosphatase/NAD kinase-like protein n=1 Tax=Moraxella porci TaxID=1288392 RepID=UPI00244C52F4|nr:tyrosine-protein phosphatase [Moraxella porci]MDH2274000.1 tyrosine-protein phosphatase [Moraxella porci]